MSANNISKTDYDNRKTQLDITKKKIEEINATINDRVIRAPFSGVLGLRNISVGTLVKPGDIIATLDDISELKLDLNVPDKYMNTIKKGMQTNISPLRVKEVEGFATITEIDTRINTATSSFKIRAVIDNQKENLKPGLFVKAKIYIDKRLGIIVPEESITNEGDKNYAWVVNDDSIVHKTPITVGIRLGNYAEIIGGLSVDDLVVTRGILYLRDGKLVNISAIEEGSAYVFK